MRSRACARAMRRSRPAAWPTAWTRSSATPPRPMAEVVLVRHAETEWSIAGKHTGRTDIPLTDHGREVAAELAPRFADRSFALVLSSPLSRAHDTAGLAGLP